MIVTAIGGLSTGPAHIQPQIEETLDGIKRTYGPPDKIEKDVKRQFRTFPGFLPNGQAIIQFNDVKGDVWFYGQTQLMADQNKIRYIWVTGPAHTDKIFAPRPTSEGRGASSSSREGSIGLVKAEVAYDRDDYIFTTSGITIKIIRAAANMKFVVVGYSLTPPAKIPAMPKEAVTWSKKPAPSSDNGPEIMMREIRELRDKYQKELKGREDAVNALRPYVTTIKGQRYDPVNEIGSVSWPLSEVTGSKVLFLSGEAAIFEVPATEDAFELHVKGYNPLKITGKDYVKKHTK